MDAFFKNGKTIILPIDHGVAVPVPGLENPLSLIEQLNPYVDGYVVNLGLALKAAELLENKGLCLRTDAYNTKTEGKGAGSVNMFDMEMAEMVEANAVMNMLFPFNENEETIIQNCADLISDSYEVDIPVILETLPYGLGQVSHYTLDKIGFAVRFAAEMGADIVKTAYPIDASVEQFRRVVESCYVPVIVLGGAPMETDEKLLTMVSNAMNAGCAGIAVGRNVWQHSKPLQIAKALHAIVHEHASVSQALEVMKEN